MLCLIQDRRFCLPCSISEIAAKDLRLMLDAVVGSSDCKNTLKLFDKTTTKMHFVFLKNNKFFTEIH